MTTGRPFFVYEYFYDALNPTVVLGGLRQNGSITEENFIDMLAILLITETPIVVRHRESGHAVTRTISSL